MKLPTDNLRFGSSLSSLISSMAMLLPQITRQVNAVSEGRLSGTYNAMTAPPANGLWAQGDYIRNSAPQVLGPAGSKYLVRGWVCVVGGEPGTWVQDRGLTGT